LQEVNWNSGPLDLGRSFAGVIYSVQRSISQVLLECQSGFGRSSFVALVNVSPEEQEHFMNDEVRMFLAGYETENIRFVYGSDNDAPISIKVNPSLDPFMSFEARLFIFTHYKGCGRRNRQTIEQACLPHHRSRYI
ncbi:hypothetical protein COOONC_06546, partial [Cooperia oncophora]